MAVKNITPVKSEFNQITKVTFEAPTTLSDGVNFKCPTTDEYIVILVQNTGTEAGTVNVKAPVKGSYAAASEDLTMQLAAGEIASIRIESARYAENDGIVTVVTSKTAVKVAVIY